MYKLLSVRPANLLFYYVCLFMSLVLFHKEKQKVINKSKQ